MKKTFYLLTILALLLLPAAATGNLATARALEQTTQAPAANVLFVMVGGSGNCSSWAEACGLQTALVEADPGEEIWVQAGTYTPTTGADRAATIQLKNGVAIYGGFAGTETQRGQRDWMTNLTYLSGDIGVAADNSDNSYHVVTGSGVNATAILDGFIISDGYANGGTQADYGAGMYNNAGSPSLAYLIFTDNEAAYGGGGMYNYTGSNPSLTAVIFAENDADYGAGMYNSASSPILENTSFSDNDADASGGGMLNSNNSAPVLTDVIFTGNTAVGSGGGMRNISNSGPSLTRVEFNANTANTGGGMANQSSSPTLTEVTFAGNTAVGAGAGMYNSSASAPTLTEVVFSENAAGQDGGGMYNTSSNPTLSDVAFTRNTAVDFGGGMYNLTSSPLLTNLTFYGNTSGQSGAGIYNNTSNPPLTNVIFAGNHTNVDGGAMYNFTSSPALTNITVANNLSDHNGGGIANYLGSNPTITNAIFWGNLPIEIDNRGTSVPIIAYSDIMGGCPSGASCSHVINNNPQFIRTPSAGADSTWGTSDDDYGDLHFSLTSPVIDAGDNSAVPGGVLTDLDGNSRFFDVLIVADTGNGSAPIVDMGAYEAWAETVPPTVFSILRANPSPTNAASVGFTVTFSEAVSGVATSDFTLTVTGLSGALVSGVSGGPTVYTVTVSTGTGDGTLRLDVPDTATVTDLAGNPLAGLPYEAGESYTIDRSAPSVDTSLRADPSPTNAASVDFTVTFSEAVSGVAEDDFELAVTGLSGALVTGVSGGPTVYTVSVATGTGDGTLRLDVPDTATVTDLAGNPLAGLPYEAGESYTIDRSAPSVDTSLRADSDPTNAASVDFTVTFSEAVSGVADDDFELTVTGLTGATVTDVSGGPTVYTVTVSTGTGDGTLRLDIPDTATVSDLAGNLLVGLPYEAGESYTIDKTAPTVVSILRADPNPTYAASVNFTVTFSEDVSGVEVDDFSLFTTGSLSGSEVTGVSGSGAVYTVTVNVGTGNGTLRLDIPDTATISDLADNSLSDLPYTTGEAYAIPLKIYLPLMMKYTP